MRYMFVDTAKAIALYLVIVGHTVPSDSNFFHFIFAFHMPAFFFLSGYCMEKKEELFSCYCIKKGRALLIPYFIFSLLGLLIMAVFPNDWLVQTSWQDYLVRYIYIAQPYALGSVWFLVCLFFSSIGSFCVLKIWSGKNAWYLLPVALVFSIAGAWLYRVSTAKLYSRYPMKMDSALMAVAFMLFGYILKKNGKFENWNKWILYAGLVTLPFVVWLFGCRLNGYVNICDCIYDHYRYYMIASLAGCLWILVIGRLLQNIRWLRWLGANTLPMFAIHSFFLWGLESVHGAIINHHYSYLEDGAMPLVMSVLTYAACVPFALLYNKIRTEVKKIPALIRKQA